MTFGEKIKVERSKQHVTQTEVAEQLHVSRKTVSSWETGRSYPDIRTLIQLSDIYHLSLDRLLREDIIMINHYEKQAAISNHNAIIARASYYLNIILLFTTLVNRVNTFPIGNELALIWLVNLIVLLTLVDWRYLLKPSTTRRLLIIAGVVVVPVTLFLVSPNLPNQSTFSWGALTGEITISCGYVASVLFALLDRTFTGIK